MFNIVKISYKGFTLIESVVALFVFLIIMLALSSTFTQSFTGYKNARAVQRDVENAQFALNLMAKELRTSTVVSPDAPAPTGTKTVKFYDHSQGKCFQYNIDATNKTLQMRSMSVPDPPSSVTSNKDVWRVNYCKNNNISVSYATLSTGVSDGKFIVKNSTNSPGSLSLGKITTSLQISEGPKHKANVQTTSSLRDYGYVGIIGE